MLLKTFLAKDMSHALAQVRAELGEEAVIIGTQKAKDGTLLVRAAIEKAEDIAAPPVPVGETLAPFDARYRDGLVARLRTAPSSNSTARLPFDRGQLLALLHRNRMPETLAPRLAAEAEKSGLSDLALALAAGLDKFLRAEPLPIQSGNAFLLTGPNGAGKTTVAAKLAAHARMAGIKTYFVATDLTGAGAMARLERFALHLDAEVIAAPTRTAMTAVVMKARADGGMIVADSAGFDPRATEAWRDFLNLADVDALEPVAVLSALTDSEEAADMATALEQLGAKRLIVTGLDLAKRRGTLAALAMGPLAIAQVTQSPFLADGLETLSPLALARSLMAAGSDGKQSEQAA
jgi:flagellar biosynthesis protein FlhF